MPPNVPAVGALNIGADDIFAVSEVVGVTYASGFPPKLPPVGALNIVSVAVGTYGKAFVTGFPPKLPPVGALNSGSAVTGT